MFRKIIILLILLLFAQPVFAVRAPALPEIQSIWSLCLPEEGEPVMAEIFYYAVDGSNRVTDQETIDQILATSGTLLPYDTERGFYERRYPETPVIGVMLQYPGTVTRWALFTVNTHDEYFAYVSTNGRDLDCGGWLLDLHVEESQPAPPTSAT